MSWRPKWWLKWQRNRRHKVANSEPVQREVAGVTHNIYPVTTGMYLAFTATDLSTADDRMAVSAWIVAESVEHYFGNTAHGLLMLLSPVLLNKLCDEVLDVSGLTVRAQEQIEKKCEPVPASDSSGT